MTPRVEIRERLAACPALPYEVMQTLARDPECPSGRRARTLGVGGHRHRARGTSACRCSWLGEAAAEERSNTAFGCSASLLTGDGLPPARSCVVCDVSGETVPFQTAPMPKLQNST